MRVLIWAVGLLAVLWGGYWFAGSTAMDRAARSWFAEQVVDGSVASYATLAVRGFPSRFDLTVTDLHLADPATGISWDAPMVQLLSLSYKPWHLIAAFPNSQTIRIGDEVIALTSEKLQASVIVTPGPSLALDRTIAVGSTLAVSSSTGWSMAAEEVRLATRRDPSRDTAHQIGLAITGLVPDASLTSALAGTSDLPARIDSLGLDATATLMSPLDRFATDLHLSDLTVKEMSLVWGDMTLRASGSLQADETGLAAGRIILRVQNWRRMLPVLVASGLVTAEIAPTVENMLATLASTSPDVLEVPLIFANGRVSLGPLPIGLSPPM